MSGNSSIMRCIGLASRIQFGPIARSSALSLLLRLFGIAIALVLAVTTARLLGPSGYGAVAWVISLSQIVSVFATFGFATLAVREIPGRLAMEDRSGLASHLATGLKITMALSLFGAIGLSFVLSRTQYGNLAFGGLLVIPLAFITLFRGWSQGLKLVAVAQIPGEILRPLLTISLISGAFLVCRSISDRDFMIFSMASCSIAVAYSFISVHAKVISDLPKSRSALRLDLKQTLPILGLAITAVLQNEVNTMFLGWLAGPEETGLFQPIARLAPLLLLSVEAASMAYAPRMAELWRTQEISDIKRITAKFTRATAGMTFLLGLILLVMSRKVLAIFGPEFVILNDLIWVVVITQFFNVACGPAGLLLVMTGHSKLPLAGQCAGLIVNSLIAFLLVPEWGAIGATYAMAAGIVTWNTAMVVAVRAKLKINPTVFSRI